MLLKKEIEEDRCGKRVEDKPERVRDMKMTDEKRNADRKKNKEEVRPILQYDTFYSSCFVHLLKVGFSISNSSLTQNSVSSASSKFGNNIMNMKK